MPLQFSREEIADIIFCYGFCNGNSARAREEYGRRFPNRRLPYREVFFNSFQRLRQTNLYSHNPGRAPRVGAPLPLRTRVLRYFDNNPSGK